MVSGFIYSTRVFFFMSTRIFFFGLDSNFKISNRVCSHDSCLVFFRSWTYILQISTHVFFYCIRCILQGSTFSFLEGEGIMQMKGPIFRLARGILLHLCDNVASSSASNYINILWISFVSRRSNRTQTHTQIVIIDLHYGQVKKKVCFSSPPTSFFSAASIFLLFFMSNVF